MPRKINVPQWIVHRTLYCHVRQFQQLCVVYKLLLIYCIFSPTYRYMPWKIIIRCQTEHLLLSEINAIIHFIVFITHMHTCIYLGRGMIAYLENRMQQQEIINKSVIRLMTFVRVKVYRFR